MIGSHTHSDTHKMLPFLHGKKLAGSIISQRGKHPDLMPAQEVEAPGHEMDGRLKTAAEDILRAIESKSPIDLAHALHSAFQACEDMPHHEGDHTEEDMA